MSGYNFKRGDKVLVDNRVELEFIAECRGYAMLDGPGRLPGIYSMHRIKPAPKPPVTIEIPAELWEGSHLVEVLFSSRVGGNTIYTAKYGGATDAYVGGQRPLKGDWPS